MKNYIRLLPASAMLIYSLVACNFQSKPNAGGWEGEGISFTICETRDTIVELNVVIPYEGEYLAQMYYSLDITDGKFSSYRDGNTFIGIPDANLEGEFVSSKLAKGTFNGVAWTALPVNKEEN